MTDETVTDEVVEPDEVVEEETFSAEYVRTLRAEAAEHRVRAKRTDELSAALWLAQVSATGKLADPSDLAMPTDADPTDAEAVAAAVDELLSRKPHLVSRKVAGAVGQGATPVAADVDLAGLLRSRA